MGQRAYFHGVDAMRFFAAVLVMSFHLTYAITLNTDSIPGSILGGRVAFPELQFLRFGWVGVEIFFVISGLVIANAARHASAGRFLASRALRLYPAAWICATVTLGALIAYGAPTLRQYVASLLLLPVRPWVDGVYWTLVVEMEFYVLIFALLYFKRIQHLPSVAAGLAIYSALYIAVSFFVDLPVMILGRHACFFALGIYIWMGKDAPWPLMAFAALTGCVEIWQKSAQLGDASLPPVLIWAAATAAILALVRAPLTRFTSQLRILGMMTYPIYLLHNVAGVSVMRFATDAGLHRYAALALGVSLVLLASFVIASYLEPQLKRLLAMCIPSNYLPVREPLEAASPP